MMSHFETELQEQPEALARLLRERSAVEAVGARIRALAPRFVLIAARGSSDNAARYAHYLFGLRHGLPVALAAPSLFTRYGGTLALRDALVIGISQSGQSPDIVAVIEAARKQSALTLALSNDPSSPLAQSAELCVPLCAGDERAVAATKTYTNQLLALAMVSASLGDQQEAWRALEELPARASETLSLTTDVAVAAQRYRDGQRMVVVGRGYNYSTAFEVALKIKEMAYVMADPYSPADLLHGPVAMLDHTVPLLIVAPTGQVSDDVAALVDVARARGGSTIAIADDESLLARVDTPLQLPAGTPEWLSPIVAVLPGQRLALGLALARGLRPDTPRGLSKITVTR